MAPYVISAQNCLADTLIQMLTGTQGWKFDLPPPNLTWQHFAQAHARDDWSMVINFLLEKTFSTALTTLQSAVGGPDRGGDYAMYLQGRTELQRTTFFQGLWSLMPNMVRPLDWIAPVQSSGWFSVSNSPLFELGGGGEGKMEESKDR